jgi:simple sugar transport system permease protein
LSDARLRAVGEVVLPPVIALLVAVILGDVLIILFGQSPAAVFRLLLEGTWRNPYGFGQVLYKTTTLAFTGMAVAVGLRAGLFNIGAEGQLAAGAFVAALVGLVLPAGTPWVLAAVACLAGAGAGGAAVGAVPGALKARFGAHEVIVTIMLNFVVLAALNWVVAAKLHEPETLHTPAVHAGKIPRLSTWFPALHGSAASFMLVVALLSALALTVLLFWSKYGYELRAVGLQPEAAEAGGIGVGRTWLGALAISGALAGVGGANFVLGYKGYYEDGLAGGAGFMGIAVALVGKNHPVGVLLAAILFATLSQGGLAIHAAVPKQLVEVLQAAVILTMAALTPVVRKMIDERARRSPEAA